MRRNRLPALLVLAGLVSFGCKSTNEPPTPVPTSISLSVTTVDLAALGATATVTATVRDQDGNAMSGQTVAWSSAGASVATAAGTATGTITAVGNGTTTVTATSGSLSAQVTVNVMQVTSQIVKISGDTQGGTVGQPLGAPLVVEQRDSRGNPIPGGTGDLIANTVVTFAVASGGGLLGGTAVNVGPDGRASTTWTLGNAAGSQTVTATAGAASAGTVTFSATAAAGPADSLARLTGNGQAGPANTALPDSLLVQVVDAFGNPVAVTAVAFAASAGGGSTSSDTVMSGAGGRAGVIWTLGPLAGAQTVTATAAGLKGSPVSFNATAVAPDSMEIAAGDGQSGAINGPLDDSIVVLVRDQLGNPFPGHPVAFMVASGGGSVSDDTVFTDAGGRAGVIWTLGGTMGTQTVAATAMGVTKGSPATFTATGTAQIATTLVKAAGDGLAGLIGKPTNIPPAVLVEDQAGTPMAGVGVTFTITGGGGTVEGAATANATSDANGIAAVADWTLGGDNAGANAIQVTSGALTPVAFSASAQTASFNIEIRYFGTQMPTSTQQAAFDAAEARWEALIFGDLQDATVNAAAGTCGTGSPALSEVVDDLLILAKVDSIDGPGNILGQAGPCMVRSSGSATPALTAVGVMIFDRDDLASIEANGQLGLVILHEMGHVLGYGALWDFSPFALITGKGGADPYFNGAQANAAFDRVGGTAYVAGPSVPVENTGGAGTRDGHWRESVFDRELMTRYLDVGAQPQPLSIVSLGSLWDMNYQVVYADADVFAWPAPPALRVAGSKLEMRDDILRIPVMVIDPDGRVVDVIRPRRQ